MFRKKQQQKNAFKDLLFFDVTYKNWNELFLNEP